MAAVTTELVHFPSGSVAYHFGSFSQIFPTLSGDREVVFVTDENIHRLYPHLFSDTHCLVLPAGEKAKDISLLEGYLGQLLHTGLSRSGMLVAIGGGVVTDVTGLLASLYMRGISFGFVPTSLLALTDAATGGKNGMNLGLHKNTAGTFRHPGFLLCDTAFLATLPLDEWQNGFAEIIKYGCILDHELLLELKQHNVNWYRDNPEPLLQLVKRCIQWKNEIVLADEREKDQRKLLNFGHTLGHAIENLYGFSHGQAVSIGMVVACTISESITGFPSAATHEIAQLLQQYGLPVGATFNVEQLMNLLQHDKKKSKDSVDYILLESPGKGVVHPLTFSTVKNMLETYARNH